MFRVKFITVIAIVAMTVLSSSTNVKNKEMQQIYYTQEGNAYVLKTVTKYTRSVALVSGNQLGFVVTFNNSPFTPPDYTSFKIVTNKRIVPVMFFAGMEGAVSNDVSVNISTPYFIMQRSGTFKTDYLKALSKMIPNINMIMYTDNGNYGYGLKYGQSVLSDQDFIEVTQGCDFFIADILGYAMVGRQHNPTILTPSGNYNLGISFAYFEMQ